MRNKIICSLLLLLAIVTLSAARRPPKIVDPVSYNGWLISTYSHDAGYGIQIDKGDKKERIRLYTIVYAKNLENDVQLDYINSLTIVKNIVIASTEKGCVFSYNMDDKVISILNKPTFYKIINLQKVQSTNKEAITIYRILSQNASDS